MRRPKFGSRRATRADAPFAVALLDQTARLHGRPGRPFWNEREIDEAAVEAMVEQGELFLVHDGRDEPIGLYCLARSDATYWPEHDDGQALYLHKLAVTPEYRGQGFARFVVAEAMQRAEALGRAFLRLDHQADREPLGRLYRNLGFSLHSHIQRPGIDAVRMQMRVAGQGIDAPVRSAMGRS